MQIKSWFLLCLCVCLCALFIPHLTSAEQKVVNGEYEIHYIVLPTTFLRPAIAAQYDLPRGKNRALVNVSILEAGVPVKANVAGRSRNLLEQQQTLDFREVDEGNAVYYLALITHADEENHRVELTVDLPNGQTQAISFLQKMYWDE